MQAKKQIHTSQLNILIRTLVLKKTRVLASFTQYGCKNFLHVCFLSRKIAIVKADNKDTKECVKLVQTF